MAYGSKSSLATDAASIIPKGESSTGPLKGRHTCVSMRPVRHTCKSSDFVVIDRNERVARRSDGHSAYY